MEKIYEAQLLFLFSRSMGGLLWFNYSKSVKTSWGHSVGRCFSSRAVGVPRSREVPGRTAPRSFSFSLNVGVGARVGSLLRARIAPVARTSEAAVTFRGRVDWASATTASGLRAPPTPLQMHRPAKSPVARHRKLAHRAWTITRRSTCGRPRLL